MSSYEYNNNTYEPSYPSYPIGKYYHYGQKYETNEMPVEQGYQLLFPHKYQTKPMTPKFTEGKQFTYKIDTSKGSEWYYLTGHLINGKNVYPASGYLYLVWKAFATYHNAKFHELPVAFDDVEFYYPTVLETPHTEMYIRFYEPKYNVFEVYCNDKVVVSGRVYLPTDVSTIGWKEYTQNIWTTRPYTDVIEEEEIYKEFESKGYEYEDLFRGIYKTTNDYVKGELYWYGKWLSFLETIMQMYYLNKPGYYYPTYIKSIRINPRVHDKWIQKFNENNNYTIKNKKPTFDMKYYGKYEYPEFTGILPFYYDQTKNYYVAGGVEIHDVCSKPYPKTYFEKYFPTESTVPSTSEYFTTTYKSYNPIQKPKEWKYEWKNPISTSEWKNPISTSEWKSPISTSEWKNQISCEWKNEFKPYQKTYPFVEVSTPYTIHPSKEYSSITYNKPYEYSSTTTTTTDYKYPLTVNTLYPTSYSSYPSKTYSTYPSYPLMSKYMFQKLNDVEVTPNMQPVFVIHPIEGHTYMLKEWASYIKYPVIGIHYTNEATKYDTIEKLSRFYLQQIEQYFGPQIQYHLVGYSFGGSVAYEMTLAKKYHILTLTFLDGSFWYPYPYLKTKYFNKNIPKIEAEFLYNFFNQFTNKIDYQQFIDELVNLKTFEARVDWTVKYLYKFTSFSYEPFEWEQACKAYVQRMFMSLNYQPKTKLQFHALLVKPKYNEYIELFGEDYDLNKLIDGIITVEVVESDQKDFLKSNNLPRIATYFNDYLTRWYY